MKQRTIIFFATLCALLFAVLPTAQAQHTVGVFGGLGTATMRPFPKQEMKTLWGVPNFGVSWRYYSLPRYVGAVGADLEYMQRGYTFGYTYRTILDEEGNEQREYKYFTRTINSIMFPIIWQPHVYLAKNHIRLYIEGALTFSYNFSGGYEYVDTDRKGDYDWRVERDNRWNYGLAGGGGFALLFGRFEVGARARYYFGYADIMRNLNKYYDNGTDGEENPWYRTPNRSPLDNISVNLTLAYRFNKDGFNDWNYKHVKARQDKNKDFNFSEKTNSGSANPRANRRR